MAAPLVFVQPRRSCGTAAMADLIRLRPSRVFVRLGRPSASTRDVMATRVVNPGSSLTASMQRLRDEQPLAIDVTVPAEDFTVRELVEQVGPSVKYAAKRMAQIETSQATQALAAQELGSA